jgi:hypothetical protein
MKLIDFLGDETAIEKTIEHDGVELEFKLAPIPLPDMLRIPGVGKMMQRAQEREETDFEESNFFQSDDAAEGLDAIAALCCKGIVEPKLSMNRDEEESIFIHRVPFALQLKIFKAVMAQLGLRAAQFREGGEPAAS